MADPNEEIEVASITEEMIEAGVRVLEVRLGYHETANLLCDDVARAVYTAMAAQRG